MSVQVRTKDVQSALAPMLGLSFVQRTELCSCAAQVLGGYVPGQTTLDEMFEQVRDVIFGELFTRLGQRMLLQLDNGVIIRIRLEDVDRLADAAAAVSSYGAPVIVCDFGTAFTAAAVTADRVWRGGVIAPGFPLMRDYLFERTAKLPRMELGGPCPKIGRSTEEAMRFGALVGYRGMVREIVTTLARNFRTDFKLVATGGFARWVLKGIGLPFVVNPTLTLQGAGLLAAAQMEEKEWR